MGRRMAFMSDIKVFRSAANTATETTRVLSTGLSEGGELHLSEHVGDASPDENLCNMARIVDSHRELHPHNCRPCRRSFGAGE